MARKKQEAQPYAKPDQLQIRGNEIFKRQNAHEVEAFKQAQQSQSVTTRELVAALK